MTEPQVTDYCPECERLTTALQALDGEVTKTREREKRYRKALERVCATCAGQDPNCEDGCSDCDVWRTLRPEEEER